MTRSAQRISKEVATEVAARLDLNVHDMAICLACLSFVAVPFGSGDEAEATRWARRIAPDLWASSPGRRPSWGGLSRNSSEVTRSTMDE